MNRKLLPFVAAFLILAIVLGTTPFTYAVSRATIGPKLEVTTIAQDDQKREKGTIILGINPALSPSTAVAASYSDLLSQHKLLVTYNGMTLTWSLGSVGVTVVCNVLEKDKVNVVKDPKTGTGKQGDWENLMTKLVDVSDKFVCKPRWKSPTSGVLESAGVLDVYYVGPVPKAAKTDNLGYIVDPGVTPAAAGAWIADHILVVEAYITVGRTVIYGSDIQDICVLGWALVPGSGTVTTRDSPAVLTKPDGTNHYINDNALGAFASCEELALAQRAYLGIALETGQDPLD